MVVVCRPGGSPPWDPDNPPPSAVPAFTGNKQLALYVASTVSLFVILGLLIKVAMVSWELAAYLDTN